MTGPAGGSSPRGGLAPAAELRAALSGVRALVLDADGVLVMRGAALPGAAEALARLHERGTPYRVATNLSAAHRESVAARFAGMGLPVPPERIVTALSATAEHVRRTYPGQPVFVITRPDGLREFGDHPLMGPAQADADDARVAAVVLGDGDHDLSYENLDRAFRLIRRGADLIAMHRNGWWYTSKGETIDTGAFVAALEYATSTRARLTGKPAPPMFRAAFAGLAADVAAAGGRRLVRDQVAMVGDHAPQDIAGARRAGLRGILVLSGRTAADEVADLRGLAVPAAVTATLSDVVAALD
ncbi:MAG TPA: HAD-IIA family hydrolase [Candidatus Nanopelagicales bacterium]|nr:HAD-IIA family hydrolase [Candidatus Nanopelagicales bacterium]